VRAFFAFVDVDFPVAPAFFLVARFFFTLRAGEVFASDSVFVVSPVLGMRAILRRSATDYHSILHCSIGLICANRKLLQLVEYPLFFAVL
jgi:hypothetical protein